MRYVNVRVKSWLKPDMIIITMDVIKMIKLMGEFYFYHKKSIIVV